MIMFCFFTFYLYSGSYVDSKCRLNNNKDSKSNDAWKNSIHSIVNSLLIAVLNRFVQSRRKCRSLSDQGSSASMEISLRTIAWLSPFSLWISMCRLTESLTFCTSSQSAGLCTWRVGLTGGKPAQMPVTFNTSKSVDVRGLTLYVAFSTRTLATQNLIALNEKGHFKEDSLWS